jgi:2'-5' RNA ligase
VDDEELEAALQTAEEQVAREIRAILSQVAGEYASALEDATELVAARFSVSRIASMWAQRMPRMMRRLLRVAEAAADASAAQVEAPLPDGWYDLPGRYEDDTLPPQLWDYVTSTEHLLNAVGERLADVATRELAAGVNAGEDVDALRARLLAAFDREGAQLGPTRERLIAATEASRAWNSATLAAGQALTGPDRPLVKQWRTRGDGRVRHAHDEVDGQLRLLDDAFQVAGVAMQAPGDPDAPPELVCNCRCILKLSTADRTAALESKGLSAGRVLDSTVSAAADGSHLKGAMIALMPTPEDAQRLAIEGGEAPEDLHCTLFFLGGDGDAIPEEQRDELFERLEEAVGNLDQNIQARIFGANHWNPDSDNPSWVWAVGDGEGLPDGSPSMVDALTAAEYAAYATFGAENLPEPYSPWAAHICAAYSDDPERFHDLVSRVGPITFDRIRVAFAGDYSDIPLGPPEEEEPPMATPVQVAAQEPPTLVRTWTTPEGTALAFENEETGDGRIFTPGALKWSGAGPWPLQYAEEMRGGHDGAELCGAIQSVTREGDRIPGTGVLYSLTSAGYDAEWLLEQGAPLGVSVDLDDVTMEFVDRSPATEDGEEELPLILAASFAQVSVLPMEDGSYAVTATGGGEWTASAGGTLARTNHTTQFITGPGGTMSLLPDVPAIRAALTAAAGDPDNPEEGTVVHRESAGDYLVRITSARLRGATLVAMPAYDRARIVLDPLPQVPEDEVVQEPAEDVFAAAERQAQERTAALEEQTAAAFAAHESTRKRVVQHVRASAVPLTARDVASALGIDVSTARRWLTDAVEAEELVRLARGLYVGATDLPEGSDLTAAADTATDGAEEELIASAWTAMSTLPPMPAAWFREPTEEELPEGSGGVHYAGGRIYGWVAKAGEPHAGYPGRKLTIESLGALDMSHFLRQRFVLDDGTEVRAGAYTMNAGHHRDGAECETAACQFDDTRTVAGVVTVGLNDRGLWFSGAGAPWLSDWDRTVFAATQPSYHMRQGPDGRWQLRAVLSVPVPGHSTPLLASVVDRSNMALAASAAALALAEDAQQEQAAVQAPAEEPGDQDTTPAGNARQPEPEPVHARADDTDPPAREHATPTGGDMAELAAAVLTDPSFMSRLAAAVVAHQEGAAEVARLTEQLAPVREVVTASAVPHQKEN